MTPQQAIARLHKYLNAGLGGTWTQETSWADNKGFRGLVYIKGQEVAECDHHHYIAPDADKCIINMSATDHSVPST